MTNQMWTIVCSFAGLVLGSYMGLVFGYGRRRTPSSPATASDMTPRCLCRHLYSFHKKGHHCRGVDTHRPDGSVDVYNSCPCTIYVGPDPLASGLWSPKEPA